MQINKESFKKNFVLLAFTAFAAKDVFSKTNDDFDLIQKIEAEYKKRSAVYSEFDQVMNFAATKTVRKTKGRIWIKRPNQLRWETLEPEPELLISDGNQFWFYTPPFDKGERGQVIIKKSKQVQTELLNAVLAGDFSKLKVQGHGIKRTASNQVQIALKQGSAGDLQTITIDVEGLWLSRVLLNYKSGNKSEIILSKSENTKPSSDLFRFVPDKNTDIIRE